MTPYALVSLAVGLIMPLLLSATAILAFLFFSGFALAEFWKNWDFLAGASVVCALFMTFGFFDFSADGCYRGVR